MEVFDADGRLLGVSRMQHIAEEPGFHEQEYYAWGPRGPATVVETAVGRVGVAICYDRHFASVMTGLALAGADVVCVPQAGASTGDAVSMANSWAPLGKCASLTSGFSSR